MDEKNVFDFTKKVLENIPTDWLNLTTHRLDIYDEKLAKNQFLEEFEKLLNRKELDFSKLKFLPTAYDYIRLGHPLSCVLEWLISKLLNIKAENVISFSSKMIPVMSVLRKNLLEKKNTRIIYFKDTIDLNFEILQTVYNYNFSLQKIKRNDKISKFDGSTILISKDDELSKIKLYSNIDFHISIQSNIGSVVIANGNNNYIADIQHMRRRETIAMTPQNSFNLINSIICKSSINFDENNNSEHAKNIVKNIIKKITKSDSKSAVASSGLSMQYAIMMGLVDFAQTTYKNKKIKFIVPPNCYGGTNDQARRVAECIPNVDIIDLLVDGKNNMVNSLDIILEEISLENSVPLIIAEIPTNPRVEVPDLNNLKNVLDKKRLTKTGDIGISPIFILDQTFCPNFNFLGGDAILSEIRTISYVSGSKFPSGGKCTAGYCIGNEHTIQIMDKIELHLKVCGNEATNLQYEILSKQMPSMNKRIHSAYVNTLEFVNYIKKTLPKAKINFVSKELAIKGFTPSVFSLDLPTKGINHIEKEEYKRNLNLKLINLMVNELPEENKYCVSYGQLNGCYWTIPATSTQGTTKEIDKDYIARVSMSPNLNIEKIKEIFKNFVDHL
ncbi:cystathionine beta-synthase [Flavobacteriales bacterium]|nr:cystathionine beta-synthase [Flavobacteriales bacterium]